MNLRFLYSTVPTLESIVGMVVTTSPSFNSHCLLLALLFLACSWHCYFQPLWVRSFPLFSTAVGPLFPAVVALFTRCGSALLSSCHLDHPFYHHCQVY